MPRLGGEQRMQRIDTENWRPDDVPRRRGRAPRDREVPDPPIALAAQTVKLAAQPPAARPRPELGRQIAALGSDDQINLGVFVVGLDLRADDSRAANPPAAASANPSAIPARS